MLLAQRLEGDVLAPVGFQLSYARSRRRGRFREIRAIREQEEEGLCCWCQKLIELQFEIIRFHQGKQYSTGFEHEYPAIMLENE